MEMLAAQKQSSLNSVISLKRLSSLGNISFKLFNLSKHGSALFWLTSGGKKKTVKMNESILCFSSMTFSVLFSIQNSLHGYVALF